MRAGTDPARTVCLTRTQVGSLAHLGPCSLAENSTTPCYQTISRHLPRWTQPDEHDFRPQWCMGPGIWQAGRRRRQSTPPAAAHRAETICEAPGVDPAPLNSYPRPDPVAARASASQHRPFETVGRTDSRYSRRHGLRAVPLTVCRLGRHGNRRWPSLQQAPCSKA
jgi:hypothetical protein